ncbi:MAG: hypothetical protein ACOCPD_07800, partial [Segatella copri]
LLLRKQLPRRTKLSQNKNSSILNKKPRGIILWAFLISISFLHVEIVIKFYSLCLANEKETGNEKRP